MLVIQQLESGKQLRYLSANNKCIKNVWAKWHQSKTRLLQDSTATFDNPSNPKLSKQSRIKFSVRANNLWNGEIFAHRKGVTMYSYVSQHKISCVLVKRITDYMLS